MAIRDPELAGWLLGSLSSGLIAIDAAGALTAYNEAAQRILGVPDGPLGPCLGRDFRAALGERPQVVQLLADALDGRERPSRAELVLDAVPGRPEGTIGFTVLSIRDEASALRGAAIQFRDLSAFERMDEQERLRDRLAALGEMAAGLAHELRNPLAGMEVLAGLLRRKLLEGSQEHGLVVDMLSQLRVMARSLDETLEFVRPARAAPAEVDPVSLIDECLDRARARVPFPGKIERRCAGPLPALVADAEQLRAAFTDLLVNALEAMSDSEEERSHRLDLALFCERRPGPLGPLRLDGLAAVPPEGTPPRARSELVVHIADTGPGVPRDLRDRIFYPFFTTKDTGSGVGLANAQKVFTDHGGSIELENAPQRGAVFRVRLPLRGGQG